MNPQDEYKNAMAELEAAKARSDEATAYAALWAEKKSLALAAVAHIEGRLSELQKRVNESTRTAP